MMIWANVFAALFSFLAGCFCGVMGSKGWMILCFAMSLLNVFIIVTYSINGWY